MGLFGKKKAAPVEGSEQAPDIVSNVSVKRKKKDTLASVLHESVLENVLEELRENKSFIADVDDESVYVTLALDVNDIGGLSKSSARNDEAKGSIIECINSGRIKAIVTQELIDIDTVLFIPDALTMDAMDEFGLLSAAEYKLAFVHPEDGISVTEYAVGFGRVKQLVDKNKLVVELLSELGAAGYKNDDVDDGFDYDYGDANFDEHDDDIEDDDDVDDDVPFFDDSSDDGFDVSPAASDSIPVTDSHDVMDVDDDDDYIGSDDDFEADDIYEIDDTVSETDVSDDDTYSDDYDDVPYEEPAVDTTDGDTYDSDVNSDNDITEEQMQEAVVRRFYSDDLGLEVTTAPFDVQFMQDDSLILFDENRDASGPNGWVVEQLNQMSKDANNELMRLHQQNLLAMRTQFFHLISLHCEKIQKDLDVTDVDTQYGQMAMNLRRQKTDAMGSIGSLVMSRKQDLISEFEKNVQKVGEDAAHAAMRQYRERYGRIHEGQLAAIESDVKEQIETEYQSAVRDMNDARRVEASKLLDYGITETLRVVSDKYMALLDEEQAVYTQYRSEMQTFLDSQRGHGLEQNNVNVEADNRLHLQMVESMRMEHQMKLQQITSEYETKMVTLRAEIEQMRAANDITVRQKDADCDSRVKLAQAETERIRTQYERLLTRYEELGDKKDQEYSRKYAEQISELKEERKTAQAELKQANDSRKRNTIIIAMFVLVGIVAALLVGWLFGVNSNVNSALNDAQNSIVSEFNNRVDGLENKSTQAPTESPVVTPTEAPTTVPTEALTESRSETPVDNANSSVVNGDVT